MRSSNKLIIVIFTFTILLGSLSINAQGYCKDIIACNTATEGEYNLLLKVRDPSRSGLQTLCIIPNGYEYTYNHPWSGKSIDFQVKHKFIGVTSLGDRLPNIIKPGMMFSDAGLAFGEADTLSNWKNPTKYAWDDFDWLRYACQDAENEREAVRLLTEDVVDKYHATAVPANLFVIGPDKCYVIEADAVRYDIKEVKDVVVMSNYAKELWRKSLVYRSIGSSFNSSFEGNVRRGGVVRLGLGSLFGIKVTKIGNDFIEVKQVPFQITMGNIIGKKLDFFNKIKINLGEVKIVGPFSVRFNGIHGKKAEISVCFEYKEWEKQMMSHINSKKGIISVDDMIVWSRLHDDDLDGFRGMCGKKDAYKYEGAMIYKIPKKDYEMLSEGWFSANHPCSSIYVPIHICVNDIYDPYENGDAAELSLQLLENYGHDYLSYYFSKTEEVFLKEIDNVIKNLEGLDKNEISELLTEVDMSMQYQAFLTQELWLDSNKHENSESIENIIRVLWFDDYYESLYHMNSAVSKLQYIKNSNDFIEKICNIALNICKTKISLTNKYGYDTDKIEDEYQKADSYFNREEYDKGFNSLSKVYSDCDKLSGGYKLTEEHDGQYSYSGSSGFPVFIIFVFVLLIILLFIVLIYRKGKKK